VRHLPALLRHLLLCRHDNVIVVGSSSRTDEMSTFSNYGKGTVHLLAPGEGILSTTYNSW
jgi:hypothetical protein